MRWSKSMLSNRCYDYFTQYFLIRKIATDIVDGIIITDYKPEQHWFETSRCAFCIILRIFGKGDSTSVLLVSMCSWIITNSSWNWSTTSPCDDNKRQQSPPITAYGIHGRVLIRIDFLLARDTLETCLSLCYRMSVMAIGVKREIIPIEEIFRYNSAIIWSDCVYLLALFYVFYIFLIKH